MTESTDSTPKKRGGGLNAMLLADLKSMAGGMGIAGSGSMKKAQLVEAIKSAQAGPATPPPARTAAAPAATPAASTPAEGAETASAPAATTRPVVSRTRRTRTVPATTASSSSATATGAGPSETGPATGAEAGPAESTAPPAADAPAADEPARDGRRQRTRNQERTAPERGQDREAEREQEQPHQAQNQNNQNQSQSGQGKAKNREQARTQQRDQQAGQQRDQQAGQQRDQQRGQDDADEQGGQHDQHGDQGEDGEGGSRRNRRRRGRDRDRDRERPAGRAGNRNEPDTTVLEDDVLVPAAGILDVLDNYAFVRTSGYLPGVDDVYLSLSMVRKFGLRRGDAIVGQVRQPREGERKEKFNPMVRIDSVNGADPESAKERLDFTDFTPLHATERLRLETDPQNLVGRVMDIAAPIGKGQRGLIVSPPKAGKTMILQAIAAAVSANNPECHLMIVLIDERPEEVTDFQRLVKGEVIASTFDRPATDHTMVAELAIERAKRLVELGHDVVVLLDSLTRLGRAYNLAAPASGRILAGGVDSSALHPPKRFFGAARNIEGGGSLTIIATAQVETGSKTDEVIFEEFTGTANMELRLDSRLAEKRLFPAIDAVASGTRREELLMGPEEVQIVQKLRRALADMDPQPAQELLLERLRGSHNNIDFLRQVQTTTPFGG